MSRDLGDMRLLTTSSAKGYAQRVYQSLLGSFEERYKHEFPRDNPLIDVDFTSFPNGELHVQIGSSVRKRDVYVFSAFTGPHGEFDPNVGSMKLFLLDNALQNAEPESITYILPYIPYQRQDRSDSRGSLSAKVIPEILSNPNKPIRPHVVTFDMHSPQQQGFYARKPEDLRALPLFVDYCKENGLESAFVVSPDAGGTKRARDLARKLSNHGIYIVDKRRDGPGDSTALNIAGNLRRIRNKKVIIIDDIIDTGGTLIEASRMLRDKGASEVHALSTHGVFSQFGESSCEERLRSNGIKVVTTDTIPRDAEYYEKNKDWLTVLQTNEMVAQVVYRLQRGLSISELYREFGVSV